MRSHLLPAVAAALACVAIAAGTVGCSPAPPAGEIAATDSGTPTAPPSPPSAIGSSAAAQPGSAEPSGTSGTRQTAITVLAPPASASTMAPPPDTAASSTLATGTAAPTSPRRTASTASTAPTPSARTSSTPSTAPAPPAPPGGTSSAGKVVVIDPGHNGGNAAHPEIITKQVPAGFGQYKDCNTTGTATNAGYPEYRFTWNVALALRDDLRKQGITVVMTRDSDTGVGPCVNQRAAIGNGAHADAVISIHGDGEAAAVRGFYVMTAARPPAGAAMAGQSTALAGDVRGGLLGAGFPVSNTLGHDGLWTRSDLAGLNLSLRPTVMIECGNMRNATEAALMSSADGQRRYAAGIAAGVLAYLGVPLGG